MNKRDFIAIGVVVLLSVFGFVFFTLKGSGGQTVKISVGASVYGTYPLSENRELKIKTDAGYNLVEIKNGRVFVKDADCKDKSCVKQGEISGGSIVCLPHKLVVEVTGEGDFDAVAR